MIEQYQLDRLWKDIGQEVFDTANQFLSQGRAQGNLVSQELESALAQNAGRNYCVLTATCTDALWIALEILKIQGIITPGFRAAVPGMTWVSTATSVIRAGGTPVFYDVNENYCLNADQDFDTVDLIMAVDLLGNSCDWHKLEQSGKPIVLDAAQSFTTVYNGKRSLQRANIACTSFSPLKSVPSFGSGGAVFVDTEEQAQLARLLRLHYKTNNQDPQRGMGINSTMNAFEVASVTVCLKYHLEWQARRHKIACYYRDQFGDRVSLSYDPHAPEQKNTLHKLVARHKSRPRIFQKLHADNILIHPMYIPLYVEPVFKSLEKHGTCSTSSRMGFEGFLIPNQHTLTDSEVEFVTDKILAIL